MSQTRRSARQMYPLVERYLESASTQRAFCTRHGLSPFVLNYWLKKYRQEQSGTSASEFVEVQPAPLENVFAEVHFADGVRLRFFTAVSSDYLSGLVR